MLTFDGRPVRVLLQKLDVELVQPPRRLHIERAFADFINRRDPSQRHEEAEVIGELGVGASDRAAAVQVFRLRPLTTRGNDEFSLCPSGLGLSRRAFSVSSTEPGAHVAIWMLLRCSTPPGTSTDWSIPSSAACCWVVEGDEKLKRELARGERLKREVGYSFFNLNGIHARDHTKSTRMAATRVFTS